jgi:hypothetical protein
VKATKKTDILNVAKFNVTVVMLRRSCMQMGKRNWARRTDLELFTYKLYKLFFVTLPPEDTVKYGRETV